jgi:hypothetical protein
MHHLLGPCPICCEADFVLEALTPCEQGRIGWLVICYGYRYTTLR